ncbi:hypothetical protein [Abyssogena phaseoliformis symbiont]|nr:hypothetical protein [Abyssogena phaseoliformis symbiont]
MNRVAITGTGIDNNMESVLSSLKNQKSKIKNQKSKIKNQK